MAKTPRTDRRLAFAKVHLAKLRAENGKMIGKDYLAIEAEISACLGAIKSALYHLEREVRPAFGKRLADWKGRLSRAERHRFDRMQKLRNLDVHEADIQTSLKDKEIPAHLLPGTTVSAPPGVMVPKVRTGEVYLDAYEAAETLGLWLELLERLVTECHEVKVAGENVGKRMKRDGDQKPRKARRRR